ncbi:MAG: HNH endonuclease [Betaproteobacteria bacterium]|nr:HNH endonuclease [Betaproteobacteria bacterium]MBI2289147.1 HNH endonuclease [Betaproteobacteria bacterium]MBI3055836.1 HNH endonuclease [Betaproteobacteria bacterium]
MATQNSRWNREELLVAFNLYCRMPFGKMHSRNPEIIRVASALGRTPSSVAMKLVNFASLDPSITSTGRTGLGNASRADKAIWDEFNGDWEGLVVESETRLQALVKKRVDKRSESSTDFDDFDEGDYEGQTKAVQIQARIKQSFFRKTVLSSYGGRCCITRISEPRLLVASHIVPWKSDPKNRLNPRNGLCLSALHDKAFDRGLITITDDFRVDVSPALSKFEKEPFIRDALIAIRGQPITLPEKFQPDVTFLRRHREIWR